MTTSGPSRVRPRMRREIVLASAARLFREKGFTDTTLGDIAREVGFVQSAVYRHFSGKAELLSEIALRSQDRLEQSMAEVLALHLDPQSSIQELVRRSLEQHRAEGDLPAMIRQAWPSLSAGVRKRLLARFERVERQWEDLFRDARRDLPPRQVRALVRAVGQVMAGSDPSLPADFYVQLCTALVRATLP